MINKQKQFCLEGVRIAKNIRTKNIRLLTFLITLRHKYFFENFIIEVIVIVHFKNTLGVTPGNFQKLAPGRET